MAEKIWEKEGLTRHEYSMIKEGLNRKPDAVELAMFGVMWSEHCSYKNSLPLLEKLPAEGERVKQGPGENAGIVHAVDNLNLVFKVESHNHPSAVNPYQGAATGVGGIIRDVLSMGARPRLSMAALCLGEPEKSEIRALLQDALKGARDYARTSGVSMTGTTMKFSPAYEHNPLVNALCLGVVEDENILSSSITAAGRDLVLAGAPTGRDGIGGASFASQELEEQEESADTDQNPVPAGFPERERRLIEACRELIEDDAISALQDLGAAGITGAASEMAAGGNRGVKIDLDQVPLAEKDMTAGEIMLSETQERMMMTPRSDRLPEIKEAFHSRGLEAVVIGKTTAEEDVTIYHQEEKVAEIPAPLLVDGHPVHRRKSQKPEAAENIPSHSSDSGTGTGSPYPSRKEALLDLLSSPQIYGRFNESEPAVIPLGDGERKALAVMGSSGRRCQLQPRQGTAMLAASLAREIACAGGRPLAVSDGLNLGSPLDPEIYWQLEECIAGLAEACSSLNLPVTGGNVSLFNEGPEGAIDPTPVLALVGITEDSGRTVPPHFTEEDKPLYLLGRTRPELGCSDYLSLAFDSCEGELPRLDLCEEARLQEFLLLAHRSGLINSARSISDGGLAAALALSCLTGEMGAELEFETQLTLEEFLFSESTGRALVTADEDRAGELEDRAESEDIPLTRLGTTGGEKLIADDLFKIDLEELRSAWKTAEKSM